MTFNLDIPEATEEQKTKYQQIFELLVNKGALDGVRAGQVVLHFNGLCQFLGLEFKYFPWRKEKEKQSRSLDDGIDDF